MPFQDSWEQVSLSYLFFYLSLMKRSLWGISEEETSVEMHDILPDLFTFLCSFWRSQQVYLAHLYNSRQSLISFVMIATYIFKPA